MTYQPTSLSTLFGSSQQSHGDLVGSLRKHARRPPSRTEPSVRTGVPLHATLAVHCVVRPSAMQPAMLSAVSTHGLGPAASSAAQAVTTRSTARSERMANSVTSSSVGRQ